MTTVMSEIKKREKNFGFFLKNCEGLSLYMIIHGTVRRVGLILKIKRSIMKFLIDRRPDDEQLLEKKKKRILMPTSLW